MKKFTIQPVGYTYLRTAKKGGGMYTVAGHMKCERCQTVVEDREWVEPAKRFYDKGGYHSRSYWCQNCGFYKPDLHSYVMIK